MANKQVADVVIIGSGIAALTAAEKLSVDKNVIIITKSKKENSNSIWAQGGVATVIEKDDDWKYHFDDTLIAGCYHNDENAVKVLVQKGPELIRKLIDEGMKFDCDHNGRLHLGQEGAHSNRRIIHAGGDATGKALIQFMLEKVKSKVKIIENEMAVDLLKQDNQCIGVKTIDNFGHTKYIYASSTVLATGGCGGLFTFTSNDPSITGDGIAMAFRAGADLADLEFIQFHPTMLYVNGQGKGLVSEAVRGEGAFLVTENGTKLMDGVHPLMDLAPRDVVAREIHKAVIKGQNVFLDITMIDDFERRFPTISTLCISNNVDLKRGKIPIVPGAHFLMGGIKTNVKGQTTIPNLFAIGEVACSGVHGANRLASNSLLEGMVFGNELAEHILEKGSNSIIVSEIESKSNLIESNLIALPKADEIRQMLMNNVGIVRTEAELENAKKWFEHYLTPMSDHILSSENLGKEQLKIVNMLTTGWLITTSALMRTESRGGHHRIDFPFQDEVGWGKRTIIRNIDQKSLNLLQV